MFDTALSIRRYFYFCKTIQSSAVTDLDVFFLGVCLNFLSTLASHEGGPNLL